MVTVNDIAIATADEALDEEALRQRACTELLRQRAIELGLLAEDDPAPREGAVSEAASAAIEALLMQELAGPEPDEVACRRHFEANARHFAQGERVQVRHLLFAVTPGVDVDRLRQHAEGHLIALRASDAAAFTEAAKTLSNCPSGADGGRLGWLTADDCAPEFARELFGRSEIGVLPQLLHSRFGLHIVAVDAREPGRLPAFEQVREAVAQQMRQRHQISAVRQYLQTLAADARLQGVELQQATSPLVQ
ncbi:peptidylprolyl isomerase [Roseateles saccharophilus]|uniref:peptidylprolyl isomerase n=1 Tax=Roseateles saccharophilus TaxID=304 RepID=A0A4R3V0L5_ROSSA|nr:peptidylprolyl isomerase [Roseateles saccharophilus]MDG0832328.1 peptidylprolyl isomerase [Roseateles saccharophilus]TCU97022.1 peptidyl-prolyl cis-trans isomerase C [Roseateles saccharophilus]